SDVLGDPLDIIASGLTVDNETTAQDAIDVLNRYDFIHSKQYAETVQEVFDLLYEEASDEFLDSGRQSAISQEVGDALDAMRAEQGIDLSNGSVQNLVIGNNATAVDAAGLEAVHRGYSPVMLCATQSEGDVGELAEYFVELIRKISDPHTAANLLSDCLISGGEPTVKLVPEVQRGMGGRNQQLVLAVICRLFENETWRNAVRENPNACPFAFLSGGTDGEDGPTDAAGAFFDGTILHQIARSCIDPNDFLKRNDAYHFFEQFGALIKTGATGTNVCDIRMLLRHKTSGGN
ncbi:MAG: glycerate kinase, partial [Planctomycetaceae bacterium]|nr:glycerate kinase [Planctomycetaceae bacterium]